MISIDNNIDPPPSLNLPGEIDVIGQEEAACTSCQNFEIDLWWPPWHEIVGARDRGCAYCSLLLDVASSFGLWPGDVVEDYRISCSVQSWLDTIVLRQSAQSDAGTPVAIYRAKSDQEDSHLHKRLRTLPVLASHSNSEDTYVFIQKQLAECIESHPECSSRGSVSLPLRVLDLSAGLDSIKLVVDPPRLGVFAALSYCWGDIGKHPDRMLTKDSITAMQQNISWTSLFPLFRDAVTIATKLNIPYLWIDCLCIIQDDSQDWELESSKMADYYGNALITISADCNISPEQPLLAIRDEWWRARTFLLKGSGQHFYARRLHSSLRNKWTLHTNPLAARGWAWQENLISRRVIHYLDSEVVWECRRLSRSEDGFLDSSQLWGRYTQTPYDLCQAFAGMATSPAKQWLKCIETFSGRLLTYEKDRLPAISGIAKIMHEKLGAEYLAGLWRSSLIEGMMWNTLSLSRAYVPNSNPSWSWSSVAGKITYNRWSSFEPHTEAVVLEAECSILGLNPFGEVTGGYLKIQCLFSVGTLEPHNGRSWFGRLRGSTSGSIIFDCALEVIELCNLCGEVSVGRSTDPSSKLSRPIRVFYIIIGKETDGERCFGLLLGKSPIVDGAYTRIGFLHHLKESEHDMSIQTITIV
ncbi:HET-domain-containing protein [Microthyrium microscopicum]|uniref:HET-domain-containing protein n=1 Tax=Microthyrium microscopicum TaxID=703497 RepID=A0A6A6UID5_9PEZI|nr:HET-domain-containing protein [Microthyrium microscopicum]